jgi:alkaline phosphatase D
VKFFNGTFHGYVRCTVEPEQWRSDYRVVDTVRLPEATVRTLKSFVVNGGEPGSLVA